MRIANRNPLMPAQQVFVPQKVTASVIPGARAKEAVKPRASGADMVQPIKDDGRSDQGARVSGKETDAMAEVLEILAMMDAKKVDSSTRKASRAEMAHLQGKARSRQDCGMHMRLSARRAGAIKQPRWAGTA